MNKIFEKNLKCIPTKKIKEILDHPFCQGIDGADYELVKEELQQIYWQRLEYANEQLLKERLTYFEDEEE